jgi:glycosyltransferase involved in cell wall biosynthesis
LSEGLVKSGFEDTDFTTNAGLEKDKSIPTDRPVVRNGVEVCYFPTTRGVGTIRSSALESAVRKRTKQFDLLHVTGVWQPTSVAACRAAEAAGIPYVVSPRGALSPYSFGQKALKKRLYWWLFERRNCNRAATVHYTSSQEKREASRLQLRGRAVVIPNAIDLSCWYRDADAGRSWRESILSGGDSASRKVLLTAGRLHHKKGLDLLPDALGVLPRSLDWHWVLLGDDEDGTKAGLQAQIAKLDLTGRVTFQPAASTEQLRAAYSGSDLLLMPSRHENFGNVAVEALACGCRALLSDHVGAAEDLRAFDGVTVAARESGVWAEEIKARLSKPANVDCQAVQSRFAAHTVASRMGDAYRAARP